MPSNFLNWFVPTLLLATALAAYPVRAHAKEFEEGFDDQETSWAYGFDNPATRLLSHRRSEFMRRPNEARADARSESLEFDVPRKGTTLQLQHALPPSRRIDDLVLSLWYRSNRPGAMLSLRVVFPQHIDPRSNKPAAISIQGDQYTSAGNWQQLKCAATDKQLQERIIRLRAELRQPNIDQRGAYVDAVYLTSRLDGGSVDMFIDELRFGPIVPTTELNPVVQAGHTGDVAERRVDFQGCRISVDGRPIFLRTAAYHSEKATALKDARFNAIWIPNFEDEQLLSELETQGIWGIATPPVVSSENGKVLTSREANLVPFTPKTSRILAWYIGTGVPVDAREELINWCDQTRSADREMQRPIMADVLGAEKIYSRHLSMLGTTRHVLNTTMSPRQYREWLIQKQRLAFPGSYLWTWIQTEPVLSNSQWRQVAGRIPIVIEPEQIRLLVYSAISAGYRGIGYWKTTPIDSDGPGALERRLIISELNLELELLEPFLATGRPFGEVNFTVTNPPLLKVGQRTLDFRDSEAELEEGRALFAASQNRKRREAQQTQELKATVLRTNYGVLVLPIWYQEDAQYVPGKMAANDAKMVVQGVDESARPWLVTPTQIRGLESKQVPGGIEITIPQFDQTACVIFTSNNHHQLVEEIRQKIKLVAPESARLTVELATAKLDRTTSVNMELEQLGHAQYRAAQLLAEARQKLEHAKSSLEREAYHEARELAGEVMQLTRILQLDHWDAAIAESDLGSAIASPYTVCFQTLPDHYRMIQRLGSSHYTVDENLLRSGDFEDLDTMVVAHWDNHQNPIENVRTTAELFQSAQQGKYSLRLFAVPSVGAEKAPSAVSEAPVTVTTPPMLVRAGQILHVSGWVKVDGAITGNPNGIVLYDNLIGPAGALRWTSPTGSWKRFVFLREVHKSGNYTITMSLTGLGIVQFDDIRVVPHTPAVGQPVSNEAPMNLAKPEPSRFSIWDNVPRFRPRREVKPKAANPNEPIESPEANSEDAESSEQAPPEKSGGLLPRILPRRR